MKFLSDIHRSVFDPSFYKDAVSRPAGRIALFMLAALALSAAVSGASKTYYLLHAERGAAVIVSTLFKDMSIKNGRLSSNREMPYEAPKDLVAALLGKFIGESAFIENAPNGFLIFDTRAEAKESYGAGGAPPVLLGESAARFRDTRIEIPYTQIVGSDFEFTAASVQEFLKRHALIFALNFFAMNFMAGLLNAALCVLFMSLAAFLFRFDRDKTFINFARIACFSVTPILVGPAIASIAGVSANWLWHALVIISTIVMIRAIKHISANKPDAKGSALL